MPDFTVEEAVRRSHCTRKGQEHSCAGSCKITPKGIELECKICGNDSSSSIFFDADMRRRSNQICKAIGVDFESFNTEKQMEILNEVLKDYCPGCDRSHILLTTSRTCECGWTYSNYSGWQRPIKKQTV